MIKVYGSYLLQYATETRISAKDALHHSTFKPLGADVYNIKDGQFQFRASFRLDNDTNLCIQKNQYLWLQRFRSRRIREVHEVRPVPKIDVRACSSRIATHVISFEYFENTPTHFKVTRKRRRFDPSSDPSSQQIRLDYIRAHNYSSMPFFIIMNLEHEYLQLIDFVTYTSPFFNFIRNLEFNKPST